MQNNPKQQRHACLSDLILVTQQGHVHILQTLLESAHSEKLPPLLEDDGSSLWTRPIRRSVTQGNHKPGSNDVDAADRNDSVFMRKMVRSLHYRKLRPSLDLSVPFAVTLNSCFPLP